MTERTILRGVTLVDGTGTAPRQDVSVVVEGELIAEVGPAADVRVGPGDAVYDLRGTTLLPGLIDCHVHLRSNAGPQPSDIHLWNIFTAAEEQTLHSVANARTALRCGFTTIRDAAGSRLEVAVRDVLEARVLDGSRVVASGLVGMTAGHGDMFCPATLDERRMWAPADGVAECRKRVREYARMGVDLIKICTSGGTLSIGDRTEWRNYTQAEIDTIVDEAHALGLRVAAHAHTRPGIEAALTAGVDTLEHGSDLDERLVDLMLERGTFLCPTLSISEFMTEHGHERGLAAEHLDKAERLSVQRLESARLAYRSGVRIIAGTDSGNTLRFGSHAGELQLLRTKVGLTPMEAIVAATSTAAEAIGLGERTGTVAPGRWADLLVVDGDPLTDLALLGDRSRLLAVFRGGRAVDPRSETAVPPGLSARRAEPSLTPTGGRA
ncbi:amidohydrolase family protein [Actinospica sp.]|jgi:imidazolonepropionase-like amidohydrolase|uniref:metal-dependent hydrolase family protein n=1 Tax=Actinospica sp. TaxID=1872142 RepID=UPI002C54EBB7|nr:amidohydrolase family protein [Actinospica sp.]HWG23133.1 amidohydrolase family protein [Actinospica sp.]